MQETEDAFKKDIERVRQISIVPTILDVICKTTGMGFAAVARVTETRWITCSVHDDIRFGLVPGNELNIETTICNEIRDSSLPVVIDNVQDDVTFCNHHTPALYGFQSYISYPIILKNGEFFGTLCAIDPKPRQLKDSAITGMFTAFADLISFHLHQIELLEKSGNKVKTLNRKLSNSLYENRQFRHISSHTLQEPLRKLRVFSGMLVDSLRSNDAVKAELLALRINRGAERFSTLIRDLVSFSNLDEQDAVFEPTDLNSIVRNILTDKNDQLILKNATVEVGDLPQMLAIPAQMEQLFGHLIDNAVKFSRRNEPLNLSITSRAYIPSGKEKALLPTKDYIEISVSDNGIGIDSSQLDTIFNIFAQLPSEQLLDGAGIGLSICKKIVLNHAGLISVRSKVGEGTTIAIVLPTE